MESIFISCYRSTGLKTYLKLTCQCFPPNIVECFRAAFGESKKQNKFNLILKK